jgi:hypothetical protein
MWKMVRGAETKEAGGALGQLPPLSRVPVGMDRDDDSRVREGWQDSRREDGRICMSRMWRCGRHCWERSEGLGGTIKRSIGKALNSR